MKMKTDKKIMVDTNILINYTLTKSDLHKVSHTRMNEFINLGYEFFASRQILREYIGVITKYAMEDKSISPQKIKENVESFESFFTVFDENNYNTNELLNLVNTYTVKGKQVHDCNIVATMKLNEVSVIFTHNVSDFKRYINEGIEVLSLVE
jgi:predicted nucleic acid-binding protein